MTIRQQPNSLAVDTTTPLSWHIKSVMIALILLSQYVGYILHVQSTLFFPWGLTSSTDINKLIYIESVLAVAMFIPLLFLHLTNLSKRVLSTRAQRG